MLEAQQGAVVAEAQLENDLAQIESINDDRQRFNELVMAVAKDATGKDRGRTAKEWRTALAAEKKYVKGPTREPEKPTLNQMVPIDYNPSFGQLTYMQRPVKDH